MLDVRCSCVRRLFAVLLFIAALPVTFTAEFSNLRGDAALCVQHMAPDELIGVLGHGQGQTRKRQATSCRLPCRVQEDDVGPQPGYHPLEAAYAPMRTAAVGWTFCEKIWVP